MSRYYAEILPWIRERSHFNREASNYFRSLGKKAVFGMKMGQLEGGFKLTAVSKLSPISAKSFITGFKLNNEKFSYPPLLLLSYLFISVCKVSES